MANKLTYQTGEPDIFVGGGKRPLFTDCELEVETIPAVTFCEDCGKTYGTVAHGKTCPTAVAGM